MAQRLIGPEIKIALNLERSMSRVLVDPSGLGVDAFAMAVGGGLAVLLINFLYRLGVSGDKEREEEERARTYFDEHGEWPEDEKRARADLFFGLGQEDEATDHAG